MTLSAALIYQKTKQSELSQVKNLNIWGANLEDVSILSQCKNLETLSLSVNAISSLKHLNGLNHLKELYMRKNQIKDLRQIVFLSKIPTLETVWLSDNPIEKNPQYRLYVIKALPNLKIFDEKPVTDEERKQASSTRFSVPHSLPDDEGEDQEQPKQVEQVVRPAYPTNVQQRPGSAATKVQPAPQPASQPGPQQAPQPAPQPAPQQAPVQHQAPTQPVAPPQPSYQQVYPEQKNTNPQTQIQHQIQPQIQQQIQQQIQPHMVPQQMMYNNGMAVPTYQPQPMYMQQVQGPYKGQNPDANKRILLAVLNLIDGLDYESLEVIQRQVKALMAASGK